MPTDSAAAHYLDRVAVALADSYGITDPPEVTPVRFVSLAQWGMTQRDCLREAGYSVELTGDGDGLSYTFPAEQAAADSMRRALFVCEMTYPVDPKYVLPLSEAQLSALYRYRSDELVACLTKEGFAPAGPAPSEAVFVQEGGAWSPYEQLQLPPDVLRHLESVCAQNPADIYGDPASGR